MDKEFSDILEYIYRSEKINQSIFKLTKGNKTKGDDLRSHLILEIANCDVLKVKSLYDNSKLDYFCISIIKNQYKSYTSSFHKAYSVVYKSTKRNNINLVDLDYYSNFIDNGLCNDELEIDGYTEIDFKEEDIEKIKNYLLHMDPRDAMLFELYYFKKLSYPKIGEYIGISRQVVRYKVMKILNNIKIKLEND